MKKSSVKTKTRISPRTGLPVRPYNRKKVVTIKTKPSATALSKKTKPRRVKTVAKPKVSGAGASGHSNGFVAHYTPPDNVIVKGIDVGHLAVSIWLAHVNATGVVVQGEDVRHIVRQARIFADELANPTKPAPRPKQAGNAGAGADEPAIGGPTANIESLEELLS